MSDYMIQIAREICIDARDSGKFTERLWSGDKIFKFKVDSCVSFLLSGR